MASIPAYRTATVLTPTYRTPARTRARPEVRAGGLAGMVAFLAITYAAYSAASLAGSVLTEQARRDGLNALARCRSARIAESDLAAKVEALKSLRSIDRWAAANGFVAADRVLDASVTRGREKTTP